MADENLSLSIFFENAQQLITEIERVKDAVQSLSDLATQAGLQGLSTSVDEAAQSLEALEEPVDIDINADVLADVAGEAEATVDSISELGTEAQSISADMESLGDVTISPDVETAPLNSLADVAQNITERFEEGGAAAEEAGKKTAKGAREAKRELTKTEQAAQKLRNGLKAIGVAALGFTAFKSVTSIFGLFLRQLRQAFDVFTGTEAAILRFGSGLQAVGKFSTQAVKGIQAYAQQIQNTTGISDDLVVQASALIAQLGGLSGQALTRATNAAIELSVVLQQRLLTSALLVAKAAQGNTTQFARYGIIVDNTIPKHRRFAATLEDIEKRFKGTAVLAGQGLAGTIRKLARTWDDFLKVVGGSFRVFDPLLKNITKRLAAFNAQLDNGVDDALLASDTLAGLSKAIRQVGQDADAFKGFGGFIRKLLLRGEFGIPFGVDEEEFNRQLREGRLQKIVDAAPRLKQQAEIVFRAADAEGIDEFVAQIDAVFKTINKRKEEIRSGIDILGPEDIIELKGFEKELSAITKLQEALSTLRLKAKAARPVRVEEIFQARIRELRELGQLASPDNPLQLFIESDTKDLDKNIEKMLKLREDAEEPIRFDLVADADVPEELAPATQTATFLPPPKAKIKLRDIVDFDDEGGLIGKARLELRPEQISALEDINRRVQESFKLEQGAFESVITDFGKKMEDAFERAEAGSVSAKIEFLALARIFQDLPAQAEKKLTLGVDEEEKRRAQEFLNILSREPEPRAIRQVRSELVFMRDVLTDLLNIRGATGDEFIDLQKTIEDAETAGELLPIVRRELKLLGEAAADEINFDPGLGVDIARLRAQAATDIQQLLNEYGTLNPELEKIIDLYFENLEKFAEQNAQIDPGISELAQRTQEAFDSMLSSIKSNIESAFDALFDRTQSFADAMLSVIKELVRDAIKELAKLAAFELFTGGKSTGLDVFGLPTFPGADGSVTLKPVQEAPEPAPLDQSTVAQFARLARAQAAAATRAQQPIVVRIDEPRRIEPARQEVHIVAFDGADVRRQYTHGALRAESARAFRRRGL